MVINSFFNPTVRYKEFRILDMISKQPDITQRDISDAIGIAVSMVNNYLDEYEKNQYIKRQYHSSKNVNYHVTKKGYQRIQLLNIWYLESSNDIYESAKSNIVIFIKKIIEKGFKRILFYGAGEVAAIMLKVLNDDRSIPLQVVGVIDDDPSKQGMTIVNIPIIGLADISKFNHDGIFISSYTHHVIIREKLLKSGYCNKNIIEFFE
jgi:FlaA1/EpsC-like NDP-sugar epimerase